MRIFGNCLVKNEGDIVVETLQKACRWCDRIFVFDNGSTDDTWTKVCAISREEPRVVPFRSEAVPFRNSLRKEVFNQFRTEATADDWWCVLDADEIYIDDPREFLGSVPTAHHVVWGAYFQHYFTDADLAAYERDPSLYPPHTPAEEALRHFRCDYSEVRFYRHRPRLVWSDGSAPRHLGVVHPRRIRFKHFQYRSPLQIQLRLATRQLAMRQGCENFASYSSDTDWRSKIVPAADCTIALNRDDYVIDEAALPRHLESPFVRLAKRFLHGTGIWP